MTQGYERISVHDIMVSISGVIAPEIETTTQYADEALSHLSAPWQVILYNDDIHTFDEVMIQLLKATHCTLEEAERHVWQAHMKGKTPVFDGAMEKCLRVQGVLQEIALFAEIQG